MKDENNLAKFKPSMSIRIKCRTNTVDAPTLLQFTEHSTVSQQSRSIHITTHRLASQENGRTCHILRVSDAAEGNSGLERGFLSGVLHIVVGQLRGNGAGHQSIASDLIRTKRNCHRLHHRENGSFRRGIMGLETTAEKGANGGNANDRTAMTLLHHLASGRLAGIETALDVDVDTVIKEGRLNPMYVRAHAVALLRI